MITLLLDCCPGAAQIVKSSCSCEAPTSSYDVAIVHEICYTILGVAVILVGGFLIWKLMNHIANGISGWYKRGCAKNDSETKQKRDLHDKLLTFLEKNTSKEEYDENVNKYMKKQKEESSQESMFYIKVLKALVNDENIKDINLEKN